MLTMISIPVKFEPQSLHRSHAQITVHFGILETPAEKTYYPYISDEKKHEQVFARLCIMSMVKKVAVDQKDLLVTTESDKCSLQ